MTTAPIPALHPPDASIPLRDVTPDDLNELLRCCWADRSYDVGRWMISRVVRNQQEQRGTGVAVAGADGAILGYGQLTVWPRCAEISDLFVDSRFRSQGYGTAIVQYLTHYARTLRADCVEIGAAESNPRAAALYRRLGFADHRVIHMNLGTAQREPVIYLRLALPPLPEC
ncbi:MAG: GNAT family N-acetyltransferase [Chloroflexota bacterium]